MQIPELSAKEASEFLKSHPEAKLIDVRTDDEYAHARIKGSILVNTPDKAQEILSLPKDTALVFHCHHGMRSLQAAIWFQNQGCTNVFNLSGGIEDWSVDVDPSVPRY